jgi:hypothetical protein
LRIGYGESKDGIVDDKAGIKIDENETAWDSMMQCSPSAIKYNDIYWVFYSGNGFGYACFEDK